MAAEQNDLITRTGAKEPCGNTMRMYRQPAALVVVAGRPAPGQGGQTAGENLVLFRNEAGLTA